MEDQSTLKVKHGTMLTEQRVAYGARGGANVIAVNGSLAGAEPDAGSVGETATKKRRGRPRKYDVGGALFSSPHSALQAPHLSAEKHGRGLSTLSPGISLNPVITFGESVDFDETSFKVHVLKINFGADVVQPIKSLSQSQEDVQYVSVLCATGVVSKAVLCQPGYANTFLTYEGCFQILTLNGLFALGDKSAAEQCQPITLNALLSKADGEVFGGVVSGPLIAASSIQILIGTLKGSTPNRKNFKRRQPGKLDATTSTGTADSGHVSIENARMFENNRNDGRAASKPDDLILGGEGKILNANESVLI